jgi:hypothetical protein
MATDGWASVIALCDDLHKRLTALANGSVDRIRRESPAYAAVPLREHRAAVRAQQRQRLDAIAQRRAMSAEELADAADLGRLRARQGIAIETLIGAFHIGYQEIWAALTTAASGPAVRRLTDVATLQMQSLQVISERLAAGHAEVTRIIGGHRSTQSQRFVELVRLGEQTPELAVLADSLGLTTTGDFTAIVWPGATGAGVAAVGMVMRMESAGGCAALGILEDNHVLLAQHLSHERILDVVRTDATAASAGVGWMRPGLAGARQSISDALFVACAAGGRGEVADVGKDWLSASVRSRSRELEPILAPLLAMAAKHPHLAEAIVSFVDEGMSVARAGRKLHVHPNTVSYRLERWAELTGVDLRALPCLVLSFAASTQALAATPRTMRAA